MAKIMTPTQREIKNLKRRINYAIHKGYTFDVDVIPKQEFDETDEEYIERLHNLRGEELWGKGDYYEWDDNEDDEEPYNDDLILFTLETVLDSFDPSAFRNNYSLMVGRYKRDVIKSHYESALALEGRENLANRLNQISTALEIWDIANHAIYDSDSIQSADDNPDLKKMLEILNARPLTQNEAIEISSDYGY